MILEQTLPKVGHFDFEVFGSGRKGRRRSSRFRVRCDAVGLHENQMLLLSVAGAETSVKALTAGLRASSMDQGRLVYSVQIGSLNANHLSACPSALAASGC